MKCHGNTVYIHATHTQTFAEVHFPLDDLQLCQRARFPQSWSLWANSGLKEMVREISGVNCICVKNFID